MINRPFYNLAKREVVIKSICNLNFPRAFQYLKHGFSICLESDGGTDKNKFWYVLDSKTNTLCEIHRFQADENQWKIIIDRNISLNSRELLATDWIAEKLQFEII